MRTFAIVAVGVCLLTLVAGQVPAQEKQDEARAILDKAIKAHGGEKALTVNAMRMAGKGKIDIMGMTMPFNAEVYMEVPDRYKLVVKMDIMNMNIEIVQCVANKKNWQSINGMVMDLAEDESKEITEMFHVERISSLLPAREKGMKLSTLGEAKVDGKDTVGILVTKEGQKDVSLYFDKTSNLLVKSEYRAKDQDKKEVTQTKLFSNYKKLASGYQNPERMVINNDGKFFLDMDVTESQFTDKFDPSIYARP